MKKIMRIVSALALASALCWAERTAVQSLGVLTASGVTAALDLGQAAHKHTLQVVVSGSPAACSIQLEGTLDDISRVGATWSNLSGTQTCTSSTMFHVVDKPVRAIRANLTALSGGTAPTVTVKYLGVQ